MKKVSYVPSKDEILVEFRPFKGRPTKQIGGFKFWWDDEGNIYGLQIMQFMNEMDDFQKRRGWIQLGGIWKDIKITEKDIKEARQELLRKLEEKWGEW